jgi:hypothetical protein
VSILRYMIMSLHLPPLEIKLGKGFRPWTEMMLHVAPPAETSKG